MNKSVLRSRPQPALCLAALAMLLPLAAPVHAATKKNKAIIAYVFTRDRALTPTEIDARKLTRINYAFANISNGVIVEGFASDAANFATLNSLKRDNPGLTVLVSVGGWDWSGKFSDMALSKQSRSLFIESVVSFIEKYNLDGLDIDWEYPAMAGATNNFRPEDTRNYTLLVKELRHRFNREQKKLHRHLLLSVATGASPKFLAHTEMGKVQRYVDSVNLMTYDYYGPGNDAITGHQAPLFTNPVDPKQLSADRSVRDYEAAGIPARKIVLGLPFYARRWAEVSSQNHGLFQPGKRPPRSSYGPGQDPASLLKAGYTRYWDTASSAPYLYNPDTQTFVSYEDAESVARKCKYVLDKKLAGVMFWTYSSDPTGVLLDTVDTSFHHTTTPAP